MTTLSGVFGAGTKGFVANHGGLLLSTLSCQEGKL
jgi:hypothetical protein